MATAPANLNQVRTEVRSLLEQSRAFQALPPEQRRSLAKDLVKVGSFLATPQWLTDTTPARKQALAGAQAVDQLKERLAQKPGQVGEDFRAGAVREGVRAFAKMVQTVDFPAFVSGLIQGVFRAIVESSMEQMRAYGELLAAVSKSVDQFASDTISDGNARDFLANRYPSLVTVDTSGEQARLATHPNAEDTTQLARDYGLPGVDLDDEESELALVNAAKLEMARSRQQLMATMVLLGINRIVITNGRINAKVVFDMRASDEASRQARASMHDEARQQAGVSASAGVPWAGASTSASTSHVATVSSAVADDSESKAQVKAQLSGDVRVSFKSETFPLERMADTNAITALQQKANPTPTPAAAAT